MAIFDLDGDPTFTVNLLQDDPVSGGPSVVTQLSLGSAVAPYNSAVVCLVVNNAAASLIAGQRYWLEVAPGSSNTFGGWNFPNDQSANLSADSQDGGNSYSGVPNGFRLSRYGFRNWMRLQRIQDELLEKQRNQQ